jgi:GDP-4-dehydro-6-deoxy-D-mannose reductase
MKKALITGATGFAGSYLVENLIKNNYDVIGTFLTEDSIKNVKNNDHLKFLKVDLLNEDQTFSLVEKEKPDYIFHLAALTSPGRSFDNPRETFVNNISAQINLLEAVKKSKLNSKILIVSSAEVYGLVAHKDLPIDEETALNPTSPYAVSKLAQDFLGLQYYNSYKQRIVRVRPFNHIGPRQSPDFVVSGFAKRIVEIERGEKEIMKIGNLSSKRDFTDVKDMVEAYRLALEKGKSGEVYNLGLGESFEIKFILDKLIGLSGKSVKTEQDDNLMRPSDNPDLICNCTKFRNLTGWVPQVPIDKTLEDTLNYWRNN